VKEKMILSSVLFPTPSSETSVLLLVQSLRRFGGRLSQARVWCFVPQVGTRLSAATHNRLLELGVELMPLEIDRELLRFFFAAQITAAARAESMAQGHTELLVWLAANSIILQEPKAFLLPDDKALGYRPVHHTLLGSRYDEPLDPFWTLVYRACHVPEERVFPMTAHVDGVRIRPYFNAGFLITRPQRALFQGWSDTFFRLYKTPDFEAYYQRDERYVIFAHQAILSGVILSALREDEMQELPPSYNYPLHLCRHEGFGDGVEVIDVLPGEASLKQWLADQTLS
jgi:hypothetical protein